MNKRLKIILLLIAIPFFSSFGEGDPTPLSNFYKDFPTSEKIELKYFNTYNLRLRDNCIGAAFADKSVLWLMGDSEKDFGSCFDLKTGKKLGVIAYKGEGFNQFYGLAKAIFMGDSIQLYSSQREIKTFAIKDIIENRPLKERKFSYHLAPKNIRASSMLRLPNGFILTTLVNGRSFDTSIGGTSPAVSDPELDVLRPIMPGIDEGFNKKSVAIFDSHKANSYETIDYSRFCYSTKKEYNILHKHKIEEIRSCYAGSHIGVKGNKIVFVTDSQPILYTFDINKGKVIKEKIYSNIILNYTDKYDGLPRFRTHSIKCNDKYIICIVDGCFNNEDVKKNKYGETAILVYDWDLKPVKKINLDSKNDGPNLHNIKGAFRYFISEDCSTVYMWGESDKGFSLHKANLNL